LGFKIREGVNLMFEEDWEPVEDEEEEEW